MATLTPFKEAVTKLALRLPVGADIGASEWADVPQALRERAFFSARTTNAQIIQEYKELAESILNPVQVRRADRVTPENPEGFVTEGMDLATARAKIKELLQSTGYNPGDEAGSIQDLSSDNRINLVLRQNVESAQGYGSFLQGQAPGAIDAFPAQELFRAEERDEPRNWPTRWMQAGGQIFGGRMIALKSDPIWTGISAFGTPYPPFDYGSGMWARDIGRAEAESLGLMAPGEQARPVVEDFNAKLQASVKNLAPELVESLQRSFGAQVVIADGVAKWKEAA